MRFDYHEEKPEKKIVQRLWNLTTLVNKYPMKYSIPLRIIYDLQKLIFQSDSTSNTRMFDCSVGIDMEKIIANNGEEGKFLKISKPTRI